MLCGEAEQGLEHGHRRSAAVEAEDKLVDLVRQVLGTDAVMGAQQPGLEIGEGPMDSGQMLGGVLRVADHGRPILVALA